MWDALFTNDLGLSLPVISCLNPALEMSDLLLSNPSLTWHCDTFGPITKHKFDTCNRNSLAVTGRVSWAMSRIVFNQTKNRVTAAVTWHAMLANSCHSEGLQLSDKLACKSAVSHLGRAVVIQCSLLILFQVLQNKMSIDVKQRLRRAKTQIKLPVCI